MKTLQKLSEYKTKDPLAYGNTLRGSLVDFIVEHIASTNGSEHIELVDMSEELFVLSKAAPLSLVEMREDLSKLEDKIKQAAVELARITTGTVFEGLDDAQETKEGLLTNALYQRLDRFVQDSESKMAVLKLAVAETEKNVNDLAAYYGVIDSSNANADEEENNDRKEPHQKVFGFISDFLHAMKSTHIKAENYRASVRMKERQERDRASLLMAKKKRLSSSNPFPPLLPVDDEPLDMLQIVNPLTELDAGDDASSEGSLAVLDDDAGAAAADEVPVVMMSLRSPRGDGPVVTGNLFDRLNAMDTFADAGEDNYQRMLDEAETEEEYV